MSNNFDHSWGRYIGEILQLRSICLTELAQYRYFFNRRFVIAFNKTFLCRTFQNSDPPDAATYSLLFVVIILTTTVIIIDVVVGSAPNIDYCYAWGGLRVGMWLSTKTAEHVFNEHVTKTRFSRFHHTATCSRRRSENSGK